MGLNQPITARGGPLREDGGAGWGGRHPGAPRPAKGGAATGPAPNGTAGEEVSVCEPAAARAPGPAGRDLAARPGARCQEEGRDLVCTPCPVPVRSGLEKREDERGGERRGCGRATIWRVKTPAMPCLPQGP